MTPSIDAFFFRWREVPRESDFFVRDWTDSPTSGDNGVEPSTDPIFYTTSDVWNRRGTLPGAFTNDQPSNEDAGNGIGNVGDNWAFSRVRRRAAATSGGPVIVSAHFLVSKLGTGSNYVDASSADPDVTFPDPDPTLSFAAADVGPQTTTGFHWHLNPVSSTHLCLAVEITAPEDSYIAPSLRGRAPGWPDQDLEIVDDNNKAQRNMGLSTTPARGSESELALFGLIHNAATWRRDMTLRYIVDPTLLRRVKRVRIDLIGGRKGDVANGEIVLSGMEPGENRWVRISFPPPGGTAGHIYPVSFLEVVGGAAVNGFALGARLGSTREVLTHALDRHRSVFTRLAAGYGLEPANAEVEAARKARRLKTPAPWLRALGERWQPIASMLTDVAARGDPFEIHPQLKVVARTLHTVRPDALVALTSLLERVDSQLTAQQLAVGDVADVLQTVRWQADLVARGRFERRQAAERIEVLSKTFLSHWETRAVGATDYPRLVDQMLPTLKQLCEPIADEKTRKLIAGLGSHGDDAASLQGAHRKLLLNLERHMRGESRT